MMFWLSVSSNRPSQTIGSLRPRWTRYGERGGRFGSSTPTSCGVDRPPSRISSKCWRPMHSRPATQRLLLVRRDGFARG